MNSTSSNHPHRIALCPGQGAQVVGMGRAWFSTSDEARATFSLADRIVGGRLGAPLSDLCFSGPAERLNQTDVSQPALYVCGVSCWRALLASWHAGPNGGPEESHLMAAAGLSLGEYTALHVAGAFSFEDGLELVLLRGRAMQDAAVSTPSGMVALIGADEAQAQRICDEARGNDVLVCANFNAPGQVVISGSKSACDRSVDVAGAMGLRATALSVAGAFHSPIMASAAERLSAAVAGTAIRAPRCAVLSNVTGVPHAAISGEPIESTIRRRLVEQLTSPVRWAQNGAWLAGELAARPAELHELAPGKTLAGLMRRIDKSLKVETHDEPA